MIKMKKTFEQKFNETGKKIMIPLMWIAIILILMAICLLTGIAFTKNLGIEIIGVIGLDIFMIYFIYVIFMGVTKYKKEFILNDTEKIKNWKSLSPEFKRFERNMRIFSIIFLIFVFSFGLIMVIAGNPNGWMSVVIGFSFLLSSFIKRRQMKKK